LNSLDPVLVTAQAIKGPQLAPSQGSLIATQPQSIVGRDFIQNNDAPTANYTDIIKLTERLDRGSERPGLDGEFGNIDPRLPGWPVQRHVRWHSLGRLQRLHAPFHQLFHGLDVGNVIVDRGPGNAGTLGDATFGGTVYVQSDDPKHTMGLSVMASYGSFNTQVYGVRYDTGDVDQWGGTRAYLSLKTMSSDGYLSNANLERSNAFLKLIQPLNDSTEITAAAN